MTQVSISILFLIAQESVSDETKAMIAQEITRIHTSLMKVPTSYVRVVFLSYPKGFGYTAGEEAPTAALNCYDNIDVEAARRRRIPVCNVPDYGTDEVPDQALAFIPVRSTEQPSKRHRGTSQRLMNLKLNAAWVNLPITRTQKVANSHRSPVPRRFL
jgi:phenylpyruvate tautomerase PptA (4-oxalocrotonate tautomerase family)